MESSAAFTVSMPEILAPAGSFDSVVAAVRCGANAVYLGAKKFSARASAQNFELNELAQTVSFCHERGVKVYLALNTAVTDRELADAAALIESAAKIGIDALIVSDLGIVSLARKICPSLSLHASTQMGIASTEGVEMAKSLGISRVVLAREMSGKEIREVIENSDIETEVFVHGAHCMCISGQCYFSALLGSRSGNRGRCAQPCRLDFGIEGSDKPYALSLKDMSLAFHLKELSEMGVSSFKIEGRMKRPEYVAAAVSLVRASMSGEENGQLLKLAEDIFSRSGFTDGYYRSEISGKMFGFRTKDDVDNSKGALKPVHELYRKERQSVGLDAKLFCDKNGVNLSLADNCGNVGLAFAQIEKTANGEFDEQKVKENLSRLGATPYFIEKFDFNIEKSLYLPASLVNSLRRQAVENLSEKRREVAAREIFPIELPQNKKRTPREQKVIARFENLGQFAECIGLCDEAILPIGEILKSKFLLTPENIEKIIAELPRHAFSNDGATAAELKTATELGVTRVCVQNIGQINLAKALGMKIMLGPFMNVFNSEALKSFEQIGADSAVASFELSEKSISELNSPIRLGAFVYGHIPLMITRACPIKTEKNCKTCKGAGGFLTDRTGRKMKIVCRGAVSEIYNADVLSADLSENRFKTLDFLLGYFTFEPPDRCKQVLFDIKKHKTPSADGAFTRGLYKKGVI